MAIAAVLLAAVMAFPQTHRQVLRVISIPGKPLPIVVAEKYGLFSKRGLEVVVSVAGNSNELRSALSGGQADIAHGAVDNAVAMAENGSGVVIVMGGETSANELIAQADIHSISKLRGRTVIVDAPNTAYALQLKKILLDKGLAADRDYTIKPVGSTPQRLQAMREHYEYAASMLGPPTSLMAKHAGFVSLGSTRDLIGSYQAIGGFVKRGWAQEHGDELVRYIAAYVEAQRWILDNKARAIDLLKSEWHLDSSVAAETYAMMTSGWFEKDAAFDAQGFETVLKLRAEVEHQSVPPGPDKYVDLSFYKTAVASLSH